MELNYDFKLDDYEGVNVREVTCKSALSDSGLEADYSLNPYCGCMHGCTYCYSPFVLKEEREWGTFVDIKRNIPKVLAEELNVKQKGVVRVGSVTDPYQGLEEKVSLTRRCLEQLKRKDFPVILQTKSDLVTKDIDLLSGMDADVGMTLTSLDIDFRNRFEEKAPTISKRLSALRELVQEGVDTWVFIGPLLPHVNDREEELMRMKETLDYIGVKEVYLDKLNMREGIWPELEEIMNEDELEVLKSVYFGDEDYFEEKKELYNKVGKPVF